MNFEQATQALDTLTQALKNGEQHGIMRDSEVLHLTEENARLRTALEYKSEELDKTVTKLIETDANLCTEIRTNGEVTATIRQLLAEQMALASRAAEMLRSLEEKPAPALTPETIKMEKPKLSEFLVKAHERNKDRDERLLEAHVSRTLQSIWDVPAGETFTLDAPYGELVTDWMLKKWYRRVLGQAPSNFKDAPSVELRKEEGGGWTLIRQVPKLTNSDKPFSNMYQPRDEGKMSPNATEGREPLPFRTKENENGDGTIIQKAFPPDDGQELPKFLTRPNGTHDDNQGRET